MFNDYDDRRASRKSVLLSTGLAALGATYLYLKKTDQWDDTKIKLLNRTNLLAGKVSAVGFEKMPELIPQPQLVEGYGSVGKLATVLKLYNLSHPMIVVDTFIRDNYLDDILKNLALNNIGASIYDGVEGEPTTAHVNAIKDKYLANECDSFVAIGGGSVIDASKAAAVLVKYPAKKISDFDGLLKVRAKLAPIVAIPTTAGTGSEATFAAVISDEDSHRKYPVMDGSLVPSMAILDPALTMSLPASLTAATAFDALTHAIEAYISRERVNNFTNKKAKEAIVDIFEFLPVVMNEPENKLAREKLLKASYNAGLSFTRAGVGYVHSIAHKMGALYGVGHAHAIATVLPAVLEAYGKDAHTKLAELEYLVSDRSYENDELAAEAFIERIYKFREEVGLASTFEDYNPDDFDAIYQAATKEVEFIYPVPRMLTKSEVQNIIDKITN